MSAGHLVDNVRKNRDRLVGRLYLRSKLAGAREPVGEIALLTMWDTGKAS